MTGQPLWVNFVVSQRKGEKIVEEMKERYWDESGTGMKA